MNKKIIRIVKVSALFTLLFSTYMYINAPSLAKPVFRDPDRGYPSELDRDDSEYEIEQLRRFCNRINTELAPKGEVFSRFILIRPTPNGLAVCFVNRSYNDETEYTSSRNGYNHVLPKGMTATQCIDRLRNNPLTDKCY